MSSVSEAGGVSKDWMNSFGSIEKQPFSVTNCHVKGLCQHEKTGCSPGCRCDRQCLSDAVAEWQNDTDLCRVIHAWPRLSEPVRAGILSMVETVLSLQPESVPSSHT